MKQASKMNHMFNIGDNVKTTDEYVHFQKEYYEGRVISSERVKQDTEYGGRPEVIIVTILTENNEEQWLNQEWFEPVEANEIIILNSPDYTMFTRQLEDLL